LREAFGRHEQEGDARVLRIKDRLLALYDRWQLSAPPHERTPPIDPIQAHAAVIIGALTPILTSLIRLHMLKAQGKATHALSLVEAGAGGGGGYRRRGKQG
jgi:hypothetical protein